MKTSIYIFILLVFPALLGSNTNNRVLFIPVPQLIKSLPSFCSTYITKPPQELFYTKNIITLNCDSSFTFSSRNCVGFLRSFGTWSYNNNVIQLKTSKKLKKLAQQNSTGFSFTRYMDIEDINLHVKEKMLIWARKNDATDTLLITTNSSEIE